MKKSLSYLLALGTVALTACSSMDVSSSESLVGNYPSDFNAVEYMALHPGLRSLQIQDYVSAHNSSLTLEADSVTADSAAFMADSKKTSIPTECLFCANACRRHNLALTAQDRQCIPHIRRNATLRVKPLE